MKAFSALGIVMFSFCLLGCFQDNDPVPYRGSVSFSVSNATVTEGQSFDIQFNLDDTNTGANAVGITYFIDGTANGDDHNGASGLITIPVGESSAIRTVETYADTIPEGAELIFIRLDELRLPSNITLTESPSITVTLQDAN